MANIATESEMQALQGTDGQGNPRKHIVEFFTDAVYNEQKSVEEGRPIYEDREFIKKLIPGDPTCNWIGLVTKEDTLRYRAEYQAFKAGQEAPLEGTPLTTLPFLTKAQVMEMAARGIKTAEQLRDIPDSVGQTFMGFQGLKRKVVAFLDQAKEAAPSQKLAAELSKRDDEIAALKAMIEKLSKQIDSRPKQ